MLPLILPRTTKNAQAAQHPLGRMTIYGGRLPTLPFHLAQRLPLPQLNLVALQVNEEHLGHVVRSQRSRSMRCVLRLPSYAIPSLLLIAVTCFPHDFLPILPDIHYRTTAACEKQPSPQPSDSARTTKTTRLCLAFSDFGFAKTVRRIHQRQR